MRLVAATIACLVALATGAAGVAAAPSRQPPPYDFQMLYERSGGFAPSTRGLVVAPAQSATASVSEPGGGERQVDFQLSARRVRALERGLRRAHFTSLESPGPSGCADCFEYSFFYRGHTLDLDESQTPPRLDALIAQLEAIISAHVKPASA